ncbi:MAG: DUF86 domain-containing protein [Spirochaetes bacterium]|nr:DUF86 domain-containing protein [Spirochaetota bacterium]
MTLLRRHPGRNRKHSGVHLRDGVPCIPRAACEKASEIEWRKIAGLRDILTHEYFGVDEEILWGVIENKLSNLETAVRKPKAHTIE